MASPNQTWSQKYFSSQDNLLSKKLELAAFARVKGHIPIAYRVTPAAFDYSRGEFYGEVICYCINPNNMVWKKIDG